MCSCVWYHNPFKKLFCGAWHVATLFVPAHCPLLDHWPHLDPLVHAALAHRLLQVEHLRHAVRDAVGAVGGHAAVQRVAETLGFIRNVAFSTPKSLCSAFILPKYKF